MCGILCTADYCLETAQQVNPSLIAEKCYPKANTAAFSKFEVISEFRLGLGDCRIPWLHIFNLNDENISF